MTEICTIAHNAVHAKIHKPSRALKLEVQRILSYRVAGAEHTDAAKAGSWDGRSSFFDFRTGSFPAGFVHFVAAILRRKGYETRTLRKPLPEPLGPLNPKVDSFPEDPRYDYQDDVVRRLVKHGQIIAQVATGGGKSRIARLAFARINRPTLFLTTRGILMHQMRKAFENDLGVPCSVIGDGQFGSEDENGRRFLNQMTVGMVQTLRSRLEGGTIDDDLDTRRRKDAIRAQTIAVLAKFEFVILEEAHEASGNSYFDILKHCTAAHYRLALTATPFMKDDEESNMRLMASSGPVAIRVTEKMLIDRGILATPKFKIVKLPNYPAKLARSTPWSIAYRIGIVDNEVRNTVIVNEATRAASYGLTTMVLVQQTRHGDILRQMMRDKGLVVEFIRGENNQAQRDEALRRLGAGEIDVLLGTTILDVGVDVPAVGMVILAGGGKAEVALRQRIGRTLRAKKRGPNVAFVIDFDDHLNNHLRVHALQRFSIIEGTEGFGENIVSGDFDHELLGFRKAA